MIGAKGRPPVARTRLVVLAGLLVLVAACSEEAPVGAPGPSATSAAPSDGGTTGATALTVTGTDSTGATTTWRLTCDPPGGDHPDPAAACAALDERGATALPPVDKGRVCTQVYGGPEVATVSGTWRGQTVLATFSRTDGCQTARWDALAALLPPAGT